MPSRCFSTQRQRQARLLIGGLVAVSLLLLLLATGIGSTGLENLWATRARPGRACRSSGTSARHARSVPGWPARLLGLAGAIAQGLFRNPLADPYLLGSASGAGFGVGVALVLMGTSPYASDWLARLGLTSAAFVGAVGAVLLTLMLARGVQHTLRLLLAGVVVGVVLGALGSLVMMMQPEVMLSMQAFMLGSTGFVGWSACLLMALAWVLCAVVAMALSRVLDGLSLGEATAISLGLPLPRMRAALVAALALATGAAVAQTGLIAFVGLAAPHLVRSLIRGTHRSFCWRPA